MLVTDDYQDLLISEANKFDISLSKDKSRLLLDYLDCILEKNKQINLTRITEPYDAIVLHLIDSLLLCNLPISYEGKYLDIGTGAGFPGVPFGIYTNLEGTLLDSVGKKIKVDNEILSHLSLDNQIKGIHDRVETFALTYKNAFDIVMARAVAQTNVLIEYASPLQKLGGYLIIAKANITDEEFDCGVKAAEICGYRNVSRETFELPKNLGHREVIIFKKEKEPSIKLPRKNGEAKQHPLGI